MKILNCSLVQLQQTLKTFSQQQAQHLKEVECSPKGVWRSSTRSTFGVWKWFFIISVGSDVVAQLSEIGPIGLYCAMQEIGNALVGIRSGVFSLIELGVISYWLNDVLVELGQMITLIVTQID